MGRICGHFSVCHSYKWAKKNVHLEFYFIFPPYLLSELELEDSEMVKKLMQMGG